MIHQTSENAEYMLIAVKGNQWLSDQELEDLDIPRSISIIPVKNDLIYIWISIYTEGQKVVSVYVMLSHKDKTIHFIYKDV